MEQPTKWNITFSRKDGDRQVYTVVDVTAVTDAAALVAAIYNMERNEHSGQHWLVNSILPENPPAFGPKTV